MGALHLRALHMVVLVCAMFAGTAFDLRAEWKVTRPFERHPLYEPLFAEPRSAQIKVLFPGRSSSVPWAVNPGQSLAWDISVGDEIPIVTVTNTRAFAEGDPVPQRRFAIGLTFPLSFHMVEDMGKDDSNPILNTDYRFGAMLKAQIGLPERWGKIQDGHIGIRFVPIAHESTHLGDEFTLHATQKYGNDFRRVNVSYQYWELGGSFEPNFTDGRLQFKIRGGVIREAWNKGKGWYGSQLIQPAGGVVTPSRRNIEPYLGFEMFLSPKLGSGWGPLVSIDARNRTVYGYDRPSPSLTEQTQFSYNTLLGFRQLRPNGRIQPSYFFRYYHGVNPAGQFRSQTNYQLYGIEFHFRF